MESGVGPCAGGAVTAAGVPGEAGAWLAAGATAGEDTAAVGLPAPDGRRLRLRERRRFVASTRPAGLGVPG